MTQYGIIGNYYEKECIMKVAHFARFDPNRSGQYATVKDLITAERQQGIDAELIDASGCNVCKHWFSIPGQQDGDLKTIPVEWAYDADVLVRHTAIPTELEQKGIPIVLCAHGRPEHTFMLESSGQSPIFTFYKTLTDRPCNRNYKAVVTFWKEFIFHMSFLLPESLLHYVPAMVDLDVYCPTGPSLDYGGKGGTPNLMIADMWRTDESPFNILYAAGMFREKYCPEAKVHVFGIPSSTTNNAITIIAQRLAEIGVWGASYSVYNNMPEAYRAADILITPHHIATRVIREASACGLPIVANQGCVYTNYTANPKDVEGFAAMIHRCWTEREAWGKEQPNKWRAMAKKEFNLEQAGKAMVRVLEQAMTEEGKTTVLIPDGIFQKKQYRSYQEYLNNQVSKLKEQTRSIAQHDAAYFETLRQRILDSKYIKPGMNILCLGARLGGEVQAFLINGCFAVGVDLNPGPENKYVVHGDFHQLQYADNSVDVVFTNSLDHVYDIEVLMEEIHRVLKLNGLFIVETALESRVDNWTCLRWNSNEDIIQFFEEHGMKLLQRKMFKSLWFNEQLVLEKVVATQKVISMSLLGKYGRFGNQVFQYASLSLYAHKHGLQMQIPEDWIGRQLFNCDHIPKIRRQLPVRNFRKEKVSIFGNDFKEDLSNMDICGYFQCHTKHFAPYQDHFRLLFEPNKSRKEKAEKVLHQVRGKCKTLVGVHLRRGDFDHGKFQPAPAKWYLDWLEENWHNLTDPVLFIASDESEKVKEDFRNYPCVVLESEENAREDDFYMDFYILTQCDWLLISNSAFSFAASMLNEKAAAFYRPEYVKEQLVSFDPWDAQPFSGIPPEEEIKVVQQASEQANGELKVALIYNPKDNKLQVNHYSHTYRQMFEALCSKFPNAQHITDSCSAKDIEADFILIYDIHSSHHITIDGLLQHSATKYTYFDDPHQEHVCGKYSTGQFVHKLGPQERLERAFARGVDHIICPYYDSYMHYLAPFMGGVAENMLLWFPIAPVNEFEPSFRSTLRLKHRKPEVLANGALAAGDCTIYDFRKWAFAQESVTKVSKSLGEVSYQEFLSGWAGALALAQYAAVPKYLEVPLAGCVGFMQQNLDCDKMGFKDMENCVFVTKTNFAKKINDFLHNVESNKYQGIADAGYKLVSNNFTAKHFADFIEKHMKEEAT